MMQRIQKWMVHGGRNTKSAVPVPGAAAAAAVGGTVAAVAAAAAADAVAVAAVVGVATAGGKAAPADHRIQSPACTAAGNFPLKFYRTHRDEPPAVPAAAPPAPMMTTVRSPARDQIQLNRRLAKIHHYVRHRDNCKSANVLDCSPIHRQIVHFPSQNHGLQLLQRQPPRRHLHCAPRKSVSPVWWSPGPVPPYGWAPPSHTHWKCVPGPRDLLVR